MNEKPLALLPELFDGRQAANEDIPGVEVPA